MNLIDTRPIRIKWRKQSEQYTPYMKYLDINSSKIKETQLKQGIEFKFQLSNEKYCQGYLDREFNRRVCPENKTLSKGKQCKNCAIKDITKGLRERKKHLSKDHDYYNSKFAIYLASFGNKVKVGICGERRYPERCVEQGANKSLKIKTAENVDEAHNIERKISKNTALTEFLSKKQKLQVKTSNNDIRRYRKDIELKTGLKLDENKVKNHLKGLKIKKTERNQNYKFLDDKKPVNSEIKFVKGQYIYLKSNQAYNVKYHSGRELQKTRQKQIEDYKKTKT